MKTQKISVRRSMKALQHAFAGIRKMLTTEHNASIHLLATVIILMSCMFFKISISEFSLIVFAIALIWVTEMINTCIEKIMDFISLENQPEIQFIKDLAAGAVLVAAFAVLTIGLFIFIPKIFCSWK
jgi:diacylglycerol kinase (ATP)